jgi:hypothetical protein
LLNIASIWRRLAETDPIRLPIIGPYLPPVGLNKRGAAMRGKFDLKAPNGWVTRVDWPLVVGLFAGISLFFAAITLYLA